jgi:hypothetical protein
VSVSSETIEIRLSGLRQIEQLRNTLRDAQAAADATRQAISELDGEIAQGGRYARQLKARSGALSSVATAGQQLLDNPRAGRSIGSAGRRRLQQQVQTQRAEAAESRRLERAVEGGIRLSARQRRGLRRFGRYLEQRVVDAGIEVLGVEQRVQDAGENAIRQLRQSRRSSRIRGTRSLIQARLDDSRRLGRSSDTLTDLLAQRDRAITDSTERIERENQALERNQLAAYRSYKTLTTDLRRQRGRAARAGNAELVRQISDQISDYRGDLEREVSVIQQTRSTQATELGRLNQRRRSLRSIGRGRSLVARGEQYVLSKSKELQQLYGVPESRLTASVGSEKNVPLSKIAERATGAANLRNDIDGAKDLLGIAKRRLVAIEREAKLSNGITDAEQKRALAIQRVTDKVEQLRTSGASGSRMQAFEQLATQLRGMSGSRNMPEFNRVLREALAAGARVEQPKGFMRGPSAPLLGEKFIKGSPKNIAASETALLQIEEFQQRINKLSAKGASGEIFNRATDAFSKLSGLASSNNFRQFDQLASNLQRLLRIASGEIKKTEGTRASNIKGAFALPADAPKQLNKLLAEAEAKQLSLIGLQKKGVDIGDNAVKLEQLINEAKADGYEITLKGLKALSNQIDLTSNLEKVERKRLQLAGSGSATGMNASGRRFVKDVAKSGVQLTSLLESGAITPETFANRREALVGVARGIRAPGANVDRLRGGLEYQQREIAKLAPVQESANNITNFINRIRSAGQEITKLSLAGDLPAKIAKNLRDELIDLAGQAKAGARPIRDLGADLGRVAGIASTFKKETSNPQALQQRLNRILYSGTTVSGQLGILAQKRSGLDPNDPKRVEVTSTLSNLEKALNDAKQEGFKLTKDTLDALDGQLNKAKSILTAEADANKLRKEGLAVAKRTGEGRLPSLQRDTLTSNLIELGRADKAAKVFRGGRSGEQALSDAIAALNAATGPQKPGPVVTRKGVPIGAETSTEAGTAGQGITGAALRLAEAGKNAAKSFSDKLRAGTPQAMAAGAAIGEAAATGTRKSLDIASPSGVYEKYAGEVIAGFRNGILAGKGIIQSALDIVFGNPKSYRDAVSSGLKDALAAPTGDAEKRIRASGSLIGPLPSPQTMLGGISSATNPGILFSSSGRIRGKTPTGFSGATSPIFSAPNSLLDLNQDPGMAPSSFKFGRPSAPPPAVKPIFAASTSFPDLVGNPWSQPASFKFGSAASSISSVIDNIGSQAAAGGNLISTSVDNLFGNISKAVNSAGGGVSGGRPPVPPKSTGGYAFPPDGPSNPGSFENQVNSAKGNTQKLLGLADMVDLSQASNKQLQLFAGALAETRDGLKATDAAFNKINKVLTRTEDVLTRRDPNADFLTRRFGERGGQAVGEGLIGGAFPLLFGQGAAASVGGGLGGFFGGMAGGTLGFGLSLAGTAIGSQVDALMQAAQDTGNMLRDLSLDVSGSFDKIKESGLLASRDQEKLIQNLLEAGNKTAAYAIIQDELNQKLGVDGAAKLKAAGEAGDRLNRAMADLGVQVQLFVAGPLTNFLNAITGAVGNANKTRMAVGRFQGLTTEEKKKAIDNLKKANATADVNSPKTDIIYNRKNGLLGGSDSFTFANGGGFQLGTNIALSNLTEGITPEAVIKAFAGLSKKQKPAKQTPEEQRQKIIRDAETTLADTQQQLDLFNKKNEGTDIAKGFKQQAIAIQREQEDLNRQSFEIRRDYENQIADIRRGIEEKISQIQQENQQKELELIVKQGQIREQQFKNSALALQGSLGGDTLAKSLADAVTTYLGAQLSAQNEIEQRRKQFEIEITNQQIEAEKYKLEVGRTLSKLNTDTANKVDEINRGVGRRNEDAALNEFKLQKESAKLRAQIVQNELTVLQAKQADNLALAKGRAELSPSADNQKIVKAEQERLDAYTSAISDAKKNIETINNIQAPALLKEVSGPTNKSVSFAGVDRSYSRGKQLSQQLEASKDQLLGLVRVGNLRQFTNDISNLATQGFDQLSESLKGAREELALAGGDFGPIINGITDSYANLIRDARSQGIPISKELENYLNVARDAQIELKKLDQTIGFYASGFSDLNQKTQQAKNAVEELLLPISEYDKVVAQINSRGGFGINPKYEQELVNAAKNLDNINAQLKTLNALNDIAGGLTDSFIQFNKELLKGGNLLESVQRFAESVADKTLDVVLEFTLRPIQEKLFKNMADALGIKAPENPLLLPVKQIEEHVRGLLDQGRKNFADKTGVPLPEATAPQAANAIAPGPNAIARRQGYPEYIDKSALRNWLISQGFGRTSGDYTNAGHQTPNHMLNAMDMGILGGSDAEALKKTSEMERKLRATGAFGDQLFGPINDPYGHGAGKGGQNIHLHVPTPGGRVKVTPGLAELMKLGQPAEAPAQTASTSGWSGVAYPMASNQPAPVTSAANNAAESLGNLDQEARKAAEGFGQFDTKLSDSVGKFQQIVGTGLQAITSVAMGIGGAQMIGKGGTYNTLMGLAGIFNSIGSITGMFGKGGSLAGIFGGKAASSVASGFNPGVYTSPMLTGIPGYATGGRPTPNEPAWIGENGVELWVPDRPGTIIPNHNIDNLYVPGLSDKPQDSESSSNDTASKESSNDTQSRMFEMTRASLNSRKETRTETPILPPPSQIDIRSETQVINNVEYVTAEQHRKGMEMAAKRGQLLAYQGLQHSVKVRRRLGL